MSQIQTVADAVAAGKAKLVPGLVQEALDAGCNASELLNAMIDAMGLVGAIHCVHNGDFVIQDHIGIVRHSVRNLILSLEQIHLMVVYTHIFYTCTDLHILPLFPVCSQNL